MGTFSIEIEIKLDGWTHWRTYTGVTGTTKDVPDFPSGKEGRWRMWCVYREGMESPKTPWRHFTKQ
jgi:hypothetical protein